MVTVETDMTDIGTGSYTIIAQTAAEMMGVSLDKVIMQLGDSTFPVSAGSGGQWGCEQRHCRRLLGVRQAALGCGAEAPLQHRRGGVRQRPRWLGNRSVPLADAARDEGVVAEDGIEFGDLEERYQQSTFGGISSRWASRGQRVRFASAGCSRSALPGRSSTRAAR
jgi:xanthine dehydrogenase YagR molybdenum-binding subunit